MPRSSLPSVDSPLYTHDGQIIAPNKSLSNSTRIEIPSNTEAKHIVSQTRRKLADMPALPQQLNSFAVVLVYTASGLSDAEIAVATGFTKEQIVNLRTMSAYIMLEENIIEAVKQESVTEAKAILSAAQTKAANRIVAIIDGEDVPDVLRLAASKDILDRTGHKAVDKVAVHVMETLRMEVIDKRGNNIPVIEHMESS